MIIHLTGSDTFRSHRRLRQLRDAFVAKHDPQGFNTVVLDGQTATGEEIRTAVSTTGFFSAKRFVGLDRYAAVRSACPPKQLLEVLQLAQENNDIVVAVREVEVAGGKKAWRGKKKSPSETLKIPGAKVELFAALTPMAMVKWVRQEAQDRGGAITAAAATLLVAFTNNDLWRMANELDKLVLFTQGSPIDEQIVQAHVVSPFASDIFALTDALGGRERSAAIRLLHQEFEAGANPLALITIMAAHVRTLLRVSLASAAGTQPSLLAQELRLHPFVVKKALIQSKKFQPAELRTWHHQLVQADVHLKSTPHDPETLLDMMIVKF